MKVERRLKLVATDRGAIDTARAVRVAFASGDMRHVDQHFGAAESFAVYAVDRERAGFAEAVQFDRVAMDGNEDKLGARIDALDGCVAVYCQAAGSSAVSQLRARGIQAVKVAPGAEIQALIEALQGELRQGPSPWLARALERHGPRDERRFDAMEREGWVE
jgi:nitrogen fixation protein NifX